ncbi:MAG: class I SAM-dependent methyltransferase [Vicinamibacterales bacterium]
MRRGVYERRVFPWLNDLCGKAPALQELRRDTLAATTGRVIEIGFGSGANLPYYGTGVISVTGIEPNDGMIERARLRRRAFGRSVHIVGAAAENLPFSDGTFDTGVTTLTLCSVASPSTVLAELHRVLRSGGALFVLEHGLAPAPAVARWQQRLNRLQQFVACGCNLNRPMTSLVTDAGFRFETLRTFQAPGVPRPLGWITAGRAMRT